MNLKQWQQKNKLTDQQAANNCNLPKKTYIYIRDKRETGTRYSNILRIQFATGIPGEDLVDGVNALKRLIKRIKS